MQLVCKPQAGQEENGRSVISQLSFFHQPKTRPPGRLERFKMRGLTRRRSVPRALREHDVTNSNSGYYTAVVSQW